MSISRRKFLEASAGTAGLGAAVASIPEALFAADELQVCPVQPEPIPHTIATPFGTTIHFFFPGPVEGIDDNTGHDPSVITDFSGIIAQADLDLTGTGTDLATGDTAPYDFHCDMRFMNGSFVAADGRTHNGAFAFIWLDSLPPSQLGLHSYDPGVSPTLALWIAPIPTDGATADLDAGTAHLHASNICSVFDAFTVQNSLTPSHPLGNIVSAVLNSLDIKWSGVTRSIIGFSDPSNQFSGDFFESSATIRVTATTRKSTGHGFRFVSSATTKVHFAQFGRETNGVFF